MEAKNRLSQVFLVALIAVSLILAGCTGQETQPQDDQQGEDESSLENTQLKLHISAGPSSISEDFDNFNVEFDSASIVDDGEGNNTISVHMPLGGSITDFLQVSGDKSSSLGRVQLDPGMYTGLELYIADISASSGGETVQVLVPEDSLSLNKEFDIERGETNHFLLKVRTYEMGDTGQYTMVPVEEDSGIVEKSELNTAG